MDCRRYANTRNITILGTQKIWDTRLISMLMLWIKNNYKEKLDDFIDLTYTSFWKRELDLESEDVIVGILEKLEIEDEKFLLWKNQKGEIELNLIMNEAHKKGILESQAIYMKKNYFGEENNYP